MDNLQTTSYSVMHICMSVDPRSVPLPLPASVCVKFVYLDINFSADQYHTHIILQPKSHLNVQEQCQSTHKCKF